jgi:DNA-binding SARP family transcriptional activator/Flp pilus assembly protein TadD
MITGEFAFEETGRMTRFKINLFGTLEVIGPDDQRISILGSKQQALLAYLALNAENPPTRDRIVGLLWGDRFIDQARQSLRQGVSKLRQLLVFEGSHLLWADNERVGINLDMATIDAIEFEKLVKQNDPAADNRAIEYFNSAFLEGLFVREAVFEEWLTVERNRINDMAYPVFERLVVHHLRAGDQHLSLDIGRQLVALDPLRETSHRLLMRTLAQGGQRAAAIKQYNACADILKRELDVEPDPETLQLLNEIKSPAITPVESGQNSRPAQQGITGEINIDTVTELSAKVSITALPFQYTGSDDQVASFTEGLTEDVTTALTKYRWLDVMAQMPSSGATPSILTLRHAAIEQNVLYSLEGSVRQLGDKLRITAQLVELETGKYVWVRRFDRDNSDLMTLLDRITATIAASIESELVAYEGEKARTKSDGPMSAWDCYHLGLATQYEFNVEGNSRSQALFRRAIELDPSFAAAYARLSYTLVLSMIYFEADQNSGILDEALAFAHKATRLDDQDAIARFALGRTHLARGEYERSIIELEAAIELNPGLAQAHCGLGDSLAYLGRGDDAIPKFEEAVRLSPHDPHRWAFSMYGALAYIFKGDFDKAVDWALIAVRVPNSHYSANAALVSALGHLDRLEEAESAIEDLKQLKPEFNLSFARERLFYLNDQRQVDRYVDGLQKAGIEA